MHIEKETSQSLSLGLELGSHFKSNKWRIAEKVQISYWCTVTAANRFDQWINRQKERNEKHGDSVLGLYSQSSDAWSDIRNGPLPLTGDIWKCLRSISILVPSHSSFLLIVNFSLLSTSFNCLSPIQRWRFTLAHHWWPHWMVTIHAMMAHSALLGGGTGRKNGPTNVEKWIKKMLIWFFLLQVLLHCLCFAVPISAIIHVEPFNFIFDK